MNERYEVVLGTYRRQWMLRLSLLAMVGVCVPLFFSSPQIWASTLWLQLCIIVAWWSGSVTAQVKEQIGNWRSSLVPDFRTPHVLVAAVLMSAPFVLLPLLLKELDQMSISGQMAALALMTAGAGWLTFRPTPGMIALLIALLLLLLIAQVQQAFSEMVHKGSGAWIVLTVSVAALAALWARMALLHEEMVEYGLASGPEFKLGPARTQATRAAAGMAEAGSVNAALVHRSYKLDRIRNVFTAGRWARVGHWRLVTGNGWTPWIASAMLAAWLSAVPLFGDTDASGKGPEGILVAILFAIMAPVFCFGWLLRWRTLGMEMMLPVTRRQIIREIGLAMVLDLAELALATSVASLVPVLVWHGIAGLKLLSVWPYLATVGVGVVLFGINAQVLRLRNAKLVLISMLAIWLPFVMLASVKTRGQGALVALGLVVLGSLITWDARRRWERTDIA